jgi:hypothetical protein
MACSDTLLKVLKDNDVRLITYVSDNASSPSARVIPGRRVAPNPESITPEFP